MRSALDLSRGRPEARVVWERIDREEKLIFQYADQAATMLVKGSLVPRDVKKFLSCTDERIPLLAIMLGIGKTIETIAKDDPEKAGRLLKTYKGNIRNLWIKKMPSTRDALTGMLSRFASLNIIDENCLRQFGLALPQFDALFSSRKHLIGDEIRRFAPALESIASNPEMGQLLYPLMIFYGSLVKGYAASNADLDVAVFVRHEVPINNRLKIQDMLSRIFPHEKINGKIVEFWLAEEHDRLRVRDFSDADVMLADSTWMHLLFASVWFGEKKAIQELYTNLLPGFLYSKGKMFEGYDARTLLLGQMEREVLQYRLMHKGYRRFYPELGGINAIHADGLDPKSAFWDSGYRRIATKLFIKRVFLPQLEEPA